uniref:Uncharacterized protein n=1 Tax=Lotus japonicus TaxID=34305 RepID=I3SWJ1_LOTJA|nr:unknown [Lotus japonicus]
MVYVGIQFLNINQNVSKVNNSPVWGNTLYHWPGYLSKKAIRPSSRKTLLKPFDTPRYGFLSRPLLINSFWFCNKSLALSIGATALFDMIAATPLMTKSFENLSYCVDVTIFFGLLSLIQFKKDVRRRGKQLWHAGWRSVHHRTTSI